MSLKFRTLYSITHLSSTSQMNSVNTLDSCVSKCTCSSHLCKLTYNPLGSRLCLYILTHSAAFAELAANLHTNSITYSMRSVQEHKHAVIQTPSAIQHLYNTHKCRSAARIIADPIVTTQTWSVEWGRKRGNPWTWQSPLHFGAN